MGVSKDCPIFWDTPIISGTGEATDFKFGRCIHRVHSNKRPLKILEKRERGQTQGLPKFWGYNQLSQEWVQLRTSNFVHTFIGSFGTKSYSQGLRESRKFLGHPHIGHIARSSLRYLGFLVPSVITDISLLHIFIHAVLFP